jgi:hypothetical protein
MAKKIPFDFLIEELSSINPLVKAFFGAHGVYRGEVILFILRKKEEHTDDNGIWVATYKEHHDSLKKEIPDLRNINLLGGDTNWSDALAGPVFGSEDAKEGMRAFKEKRKAVFQRK